MEKFYLLFLYFFIYSVIGWSLEVIYCRLLDGKFTNRGFLHGPYCPIYGTGATLIVLLLNRFYSNPVLVFTLGMIVTSILEYITSFVMEKLFKAKWWDYSNMKFNINGRVCLLNSALFGILGLILVYVLNPLITGFMESINIVYLNYIAKAISVIMIIDLTITITEVVNFKKKLSELREFTEELIKQKKISNENSPIYNKMLEVKQKIISHKNVVNSRLTKAFPNLTFKDNNIEFLTIKEIKRKLKESKEKNKKSNTPES